MLSTEDIKKIGRRCWQKFETQVMKLVCSDNPEIKQITSGKTPAQIAAGLATIGLLSVCAPPAWIIVGFSILAAKIVETGLDSVCEVWQESLPQTAVDY